MMDKKQLPETRGSTTFLKSSLENRYEQHEPAQRKNDITMTENVKYAETPYTSNTQGRLKAGRPTRLWNITTQSNDPIAQTKTLFTSYLCIYHQSAFSLKMALAILPNRTSANIEKQFVQNAQTKLVPVSTGI